MLPAFEFEDVHVVLAALVILGSPPPPVRAAMIAGPHRRPLGSEYRAYQFTFTNSTRRLLAFPSGVVLLSMGLVAPSPLVVSLLASIPRLTSALFTASARSCESLALI